MIAKLLVTFIIFQICKLGYDFAKVGYINARAKREDDSL